MEVFPGTAGQDVLTDSLPHARGGVSIEHYFNIYGYLPSPH